MTDDYAAQREIASVALNSAGQQLLAAHDAAHYHHMQAGVARYAEALRELWGGAPSISSVLTAPGNLDTLEQAGEWFEARLAQAWQGFWRERASGAATSREVHAAHLQSQHLALSGAVLAADAGGELQRLAHAIADTQANPGALQYQSIYWPDDSDGAGAVVFCLASSVHGVQALYTPAPLNTLECFDTLEALHQHLQGATRADYFDDGLALLTRRIISAQLKYQQAEFRAQVLPALGRHPSEGLAMALGLTGRRQYTPPAQGAEPAVPEHVRLIEKAFKAAPDPRAQLAQITACQQQLLGARRQAVAAGITLLANPAARAGQAAFDAMLHARVSGWRSELKMLGALQWVSSAEQTLLDALLDQPDAKQQPVVAAVQARYAGRLEPLIGALLVAAPETLASTPAPGRVFLLWPGSHGGLCCFDSLVAMRSALCGEHASPEDLLVVRLQGHAFAHGLAAQMDRYQADIAALTTEGRRFEDAPQLEQSLERLRMEFLDELGLPATAARDQAVAGAGAHVLGLEWMKAPMVNALRLNAAQRAECRARVAVLGEAILACHGFLARSLVDREVFARRRVAERLREDFNLLGEASVNLDVPQAVTWVTDIVAGSGAPGTPKRKVPVASAKRVTISLAELAIAGVDEPMKERLQFATLQVLHQGEITATPAGLDIAYLTSLVKELDAAQAYEDHVWEVYRGRPQEGDFERALRREQLIAPFIHQMQLHARLAHFGRKLSLKAWQIVGCAISASNTAQYSPDGWAITCYPLTLQTPAEPDGSVSGFSLGGISLIHERHSAITVLHLPDAPNQMIFSEHPSLEAARLALVRMALDSRMVDYLSTLPWTGDAARHASYINQAMVRGFDGFVSIGAALAQTISLAERQADQQMGRLVQAHRATSRSQADLYFQAVLMAQGNVFNYIKMALGLVPFVGVGAGLYDAWTAANSATRAFLQGNIVEGLDQLEALLLSVIDAAVDLVPGAPSPVFQLRRLAGNSRSVSSHSILAAGSLAPHRFSGYEAAVSLDGLAPSQRGRWHGVYRLDEQDLITHDGRVFPVIWDASYGTWRLKGSATRSYQQPVALDMQGNWQTQGTINGMLVRGGLPGGGAALGRLAQHGWAGLSGYLRRTLLGAETDLQRAARLRVELSAHLQRQQGAQSLLTAAIVEIRAKPTDPAAREQLVKALTVHRDYNLRAVELMSEVGTQGVERNAARDNFGGALHNTLKRARELENIYLVDLQNTVGSIRSRGPAPLGGTPEQLATFVEQAMAEHRAIIQAFQRAIEHRLYQENTFSRYQGSRLLPEAVRKELKNTLDQGTSSLGYRVARSTPLSAMSRNPVVGDDLFMGHFDLLRERLKNGVVNLYELQAGTVSLSNTQRRRITAEVFENLRQAKVQAVLLESRYRQHLNHEHWGVLAEDLELFVVQAGDLLTDIQSHTARQPAAAPRRGGAASQKRVFETADNQLLIGTQRQAGDGTAVMEITEPETGQVLGAYRQGQDGLWQTTAAAAPRPPVASVASLLARASEGLAAVDTLLRKVRGYSTGSMDATSLEDILHLQAREFGKLADELDGLASTRADVAQRSASLRQQVPVLLAEGTRLRIAKLKTSPPSAGALVYLQQHGQVRIEKLGGRIDVRNRHGKIVDYLQEFQVVDTGTGRPLWFAHFHFQKATTPFQNYLAGHLKTAEQRHLGLQWQMAQEAGFEEVTRIYRGKIPPAIAMSHFAAL